MKVKIQRLNEKAVIPKYAKIGDVGHDLVAVSKSMDENGNVVYGTGLAFELPKGFFGMLLPRSSNAKTDLMLTNHCGILDSGYRGEVMFKYASVGKNGQYWNCNQEYNPGDRVGQLIIMPYPTIEFEEAEELTETERGQNGYGSTGK